MHGFVDDALEAARRPVPVVLAVVLALLGAGCGPAPMTKVGPWLFPPGPMQKVGPACRSGTDVLWVTSAWDTYQDGSMRAQVVRARGSELSVHSQLPVSAGQPFALSCLGDRLWALSGADQASFLLGYDGGWVELANVTRNSSGQEVHLYTLRAVSETEVWLLGIQDLGLNERNYLARWDGAGLQPFTDAAVERAGRRFSELVATAPGTLWLGPADWITPWFLRLEGGAITKVPFPADAKFTRAMASAEGEVLLATFSGVRRFNGADFTERLGTTTAALYWADGVALNDFWLYEPWTSEHQQDLVRHWNGRELVDYVSYETGVPEPRMAAVAGRAYGWNDDFVFTTP